MAADGKLILVVEDEKRLADLVRDYLLKAGYEAHCLYTGGGVVDWVREHEPALIILDQLLPERDGLSILRDIRTFSRVPVIIATARTEEMDRLMGLETGADDYVCKPFSFREMVARVGAVLRRTEPLEPEPGESQRPIVLDEGECTATVLGVTMPLTVIEFKLLRALSRRPGRIFSRDALMDLIYTDDRVVSDRTIDSHIRKLRAKIAEHHPDRTLIRSVYSAGYKLDIEALES